MNANPHVMAFFPSLMTHWQSNEAIDRYLSAFDRDGFSFFAAEHRETGAFAGLIGLQIMRDAVPNLPQPAVEIGWRLSPHFQRQGLATEGAAAVVDFAFQQLDLSEVVAITAIGNTASRHVMEKLGMTHKPELTFDHPRVPSGHLHQRHALYQLQNPRHATSHSASSFNISVSYTLTPEALCSTHS
jgi:RimJ/RimL family protein N-acetyltransferase